ncbi:hypothetical protein ACS0TY_017054 [Phlomoides rotata]
MINTLHCKTIREEERMSSRMATIQEEITEMPMKSGQVVGESSEEVERAMDAHHLSLAGIVRDADKLRLSTLKEVMGILTPRQGVNFLVSTKKLHLSMHEWGKKMKHQSVGRKGAFDRV